MESETRESPRLRSLGSVGLEARRSRAGVNRAELSSVQRLLRGELGGCFSARGTEGLCPQT